MAGLQGTPEDPSTITPGDLAAAGDSQAPAQSDHTHPVSTATPSTKIAYSGTPLEGSATSLVRSDAKNILADGVTPGDILRWDGTSWISVPATSLPGYGLMAMSGEDGDPGIPGPAGSIGPTGPIGIGVPGMDGEDGTDGVPGRQGVDGAPGIQGIPGISGIGIPGMDGEDGIDGIPGVRGVDGVAGSPGSPGASGPTGIGIPGMDGEDGMDGFSIPGPQGPQGPTGSGSALSLNQHVIGTNFTVTGGYGAYIPRYLEIAAGITLEIGVDGTLEIG